jgi:GNAT superfamily N-acetyltransferase
LNSGLKILEGEALTAALPGLAALRISVFREWPYLYDGSPDYEEKYLARYEDTEGALIVGAFDGDRLVGAATGQPMIHEVAAIRRPFEESGIDPADIFYFAESVLDPAWRGQGIGHRFFDERERHARSLGSKYSAFCGVIRPDTHPSVPPDIVRSTRSGKSAAIANFKVSWSIFHGRISVTRTKPKNPCRSGCAPCDRPRKLRPVSVASPLGRANPDGLHMAHKARCAAQLI